MSAPRKPHLSIGQRLRLRRDWMISRTSITDLAKKFNVSRVTAHRIVAGLRRSPNADEIADQLKKKFFEDSGCKTEISWIVAWLTADAADLAELRKERHDVN